MYAAFYIWIFTVFICLITCEDQCGQPLVVENAVVTNEPDSGFVLGSTVTYQCEHGYISGVAAKLSKCVRDPATNELVWTRPELTCQPRSCGHPGFVENARIEGSRFTFPNSVEYVCNVGYRRYGNHRRYCLPSGDWSGKIPACRVISCNRPEHPENGRALYYSAEYNSELRYECNKGFQLSSNELRICGNEGEWSGTAPTCTEIECEWPENPEFGSVSVVGGTPKVGSIAIYRCAPGRKLVGSANSKCHKTGEWTFQTPRCVKPCIVPSVANGRLGRYKEELRQSRWQTVFEQVRRGTDLNENDKVILKCDANYMSSSRTGVREIEMTCLEGQLSPEPNCVTTSCLGDPPPIQNGTALVIYRHNGYKVRYQCDRGFEISFGEVKCVFGSWTGTPPACQDTRCNKQTLNYEGLVGSEGFLLNGESFEATCSPGYEITDHRNKIIQCDRGTWRVNLDPCTVANCKTEELSSSGGLLIYSHRTLYEGDFFQPVCLQGYELSNKDNPLLNCRDGVWQGSIPPCIRAIECEWPENPEFGSVTVSGGKPKAGSIATYNCEPGRKLVGSRNSVCSETGQWTIPAPRCVGPCTVPPVPNGQLGRYKTEFRQSRRRVIFEQVPRETFLYDNQKVKLKCDANYMSSSHRGVKEIDITCLRGQLSPEPKCVTTSCLDDPPPIQNGTALVRNRQNGQKVPYKCDHGFEISSDEVTCVFGSWTGTPPSCQETRCDKKVLNYEGLVRGEGFLFNGESFEATCSPGYEITEHHNKRIRCDRGIWRGNLNPCTLLANCKTEELSNYGGLLIDSHRTLYEGDSFQPVCLQGYELSNIDNPELHCRDGVWQGSIPPCTPVLETCVVPLVADGKLGKYENGYGYEENRQKMVFKKVSEGETLNDSEQLTLKCNANKYVHGSKGLSEISVACVSGQISPEPKCVTTSCLGEPPSTPNGQAVVKANHHGYSIWYKCDLGFRKIVGQVECVFGSWNGNPPTCLDNRCHKESLNYPGLVKSEGFLFTGQTLKPKCLPEYEVAEGPDNIIRCDKGNWVVSVPPCIEVRCDKESLNYPGLVKSEGFLFSGQTLEPSCLPGYEVAESPDNNIRCDQGNWIVSVPPCIGAQCSSMPPIPENGRIKSILPVSHGLPAEYECSESYEMDGEGNVTCNYGQWRGSPPTCQNTVKGRNPKLLEAGHAATVPSTTLPATHIPQLNETFRNESNPDHEQMTTYGLHYSENTSSDVEDDNLQIDGGNTAENEDSVVTEAVVNSQCWCKNIVRDDYLVAHDGRRVIEYGLEIPSGSSLFFYCRNTAFYVLRGVSSLTCPDGCQWSSSMFPTCVNRRVVDEMEVESRKSYEDVDVISTLPPAAEELPKFDVTTRESLDTEDNKKIIGEESYSRNDSFREDFDGVLPKLHSSSTGKEESAITDPAADPRCSCVYSVKSRILTAHDDYRIVEYGDEILSGSILSFYCDPTRPYRLRGHPSLVCPEDCQWNSEMFPSCTSPSDDDIGIRVSVEPPENMEIGLGGVIVVIPGTKLILLCGIHAGSFRDLNWVVPEGVCDTKDYVTSQYAVRLRYVLNEALPHHSGKYICSGALGSSHSVDIKVKDVQCPEIEPTGNLKVSYSPNRSYGGRAIFNCTSPYMRIGPSFIVCQSSGYWSGIAASCHLPTCSTKTIDNDIPKEVVPIIDSDITENIPYGSPVKLRCREDNRLLQGYSFAICGTERKWETDHNLKCISGCASPQRKTDSELLISPKKEVYGVGESVTLSCPEGKMLTDNVQRVLCFETGWTPKEIPDCH